MIRLKKSRWLSRQLRNSKMKFLAIACLGLLVLGCQLPGQSQSQSDQDPLGQPQFLPIEAIATLENSTQIGLEVASTPQQQSLGLMHRKELGQQRGMLFPFSPPRPASFWMKREFPDDAAVIKMFFDARRTISESLGIGGSRWLQILYEILLGKE